MGIAHSITREEQQDMTELPLNKIARKYLHLFYKLNILKQSHFTLKNDLHKVTNDGNDLSLASEKHLAKLKKGLARNEVIITRLEKEKKMLRDAEKVNALYRDTLDDLLKEGLLKSENNRIIITPKGAAVIEAKTREISVDRKNNISLWFSGIALLTSIILGVLALVFSST